MWILIIVSNMLIRIDMTRFLSRRYFLKQKFNLWTSHKKYHTMSYGSSVIFIASQHLLTPNDTSFSYLWTGGKIPVGKEKLRRFFIFRAQRKNVDPLRLEGKLISFRVFGNTKRNYVALHLNLRTE